MQAMDSLEYVVDLLQMGSSPDQRPLDPHTLIPSPTNLKPV